MTSAVKVAVGTITFGLDGRLYEIDLTAQNTHQLRDGLGHLAALLR
jgi:hypothetical protein